MKTFVLEGTGCRCGGHRTNSGRLLPWRAPITLSSIVIIVATAGIVVIIIVSIDFGSNRRCTGRTSCSRRRRAGGCIRPVGGLRCGGSAAYRLLLVLLHAERRAIVGFRCIGPYHIIALDASALAVSLAKLKDTGFGTELFLSVLCREDVFEGIFVFAAPDARTTVTASGSSVTPRRATSRQFAGSPSGAGITVATPSIGDSFCTVVATAARNIIAVAVWR